MTKNFFNLLLSEGIFIAILGALIILLPQIMSIAVTIVISVGLVLLGIYKLINTIVLRKEIENIWLSIATGLLITTIGVYMSAKPLISIIAITMAIGIYFILDGVHSCSIAIQSKGLSKAWWGGLLAGVIQFLLAFIIIFGMPTTAFITIGILIGINMLFSGLALIVIALSTKKIISPN